MVGPNEFWICNEKMHGTKLKKNYTIKGKLKDAKLPNLFLSLSILRNKSSKFSHGVQRDIANKRGPGSSWKLGQLQGKI